VASGEYADRLSSGWVALSFYGPPSGIAEGLISGILGIPLQIILEKKTILEVPDQTQPSEKTMWRQLVENVNLRNGLLVGLTFGVFIGLSDGLTAWLNPGLDNGLNIRITYGLNEALTNGLNSGLCYGLVGGILSFLLVGKSIAVKPKDLLAWSWKSLGESLVSKKHVRTTAQLIVLFGLGTALLYGLGDGLTTGLTYGASFGWIYGVGYGLGGGFYEGLFYGLMYWLLLGLFQGVSSETMEDLQHRSVPNQGIHNSAFNGLVFGLISAIIVVSSFALLVWSNNGPQVWLNNWLVGMLTNAFSLNRVPGPPILIDTALGIYLLMGLSVLLLVGLANGWLDFLRHYVLRFQLWWAGSMPWNYVQFLDDVVHRILLYQLGGGYTFIHAEHRDYIADLKTAQLAVCRCGYVDDRGEGIVCPRCNVAKNEQTQPLPSSSPPLRVKLGLIIGSMVLVSTLVGLSIFIVFPRGTPMTPYSPSKGVLALNDPLRDNSKGYSWKESHDSYGSCVFSKGAYITSVQARGITIPVQHKTLISQTLPTKCR
jgi:hypothetical protein